MSQDTIVDVESPGERERRAGASLRLLDPYGFHEHAYTKRILFNDSMIQHASPAFANTVDRKKDVVPYLWKNAETQAEKAPRHAVIVTSHSWRRNSSQQ